MLSTITISKAKDENGQEITPEIAFQVSLSAYVVSLRARFRLADDLTLLLFFHPSIDGDPKRSAAGASASRRSTVFRDRAWDRHSEGSLEDVEDGKFLSSYVCSASPQGSWT
jgi:hypothetical protein